jgi:hypothetical protein
MPLARVTTRSLVLALLFALVPAEHLLADTPTSVTVDGRHLLVGGERFTVRGVGYAIVPICERPANPPLGDYFTSGYSALYQRDLPLLRAMGANTIRLWGWNNTADHTHFLDAAYNGGVNPIYVIVTFWMGPGTYGDLCDGATRATVKANFRTMVATAKNHPAVLMWSIGNELNADWMYGSQLGCLFSLIEEMASEAHAEEGSTAHPVTTPLMDSNLIGTIDQYDDSVPSLDIWSANVYRGISFGSLFVDYQAVSDKPLAILEYGIDARDNVGGSEYEATQGTYARTLWNEIRANSAVCIGATLMAYADEWWKGESSYEGPGCPEADPCFHGACGYATSAHPDGFSNEEWWGIMRTVDNGSDPDLMQPRVVYGVLKALWLAQDIPAMSSWKWLVALLLLLTAGSIVAARRRSRDA